VLAERRRNRFSQSSHPPILPRPAPPRRQDLFIFTHNHTIHIAPPPPFPPPSSSSLLRGTAKVPRKCPFLSLLHTPRNLHFVAVHVEAFARLLLKSRHRKHPVSTDGYTASLRTFLCVHVRGHQIPRHARPYRFTPLAVPLSLSLLSLWLYLYLSLRVLRECITASSSSIDCSCVSVRGNKRARERGDIERCEQERERREIENRTQTGEHGKRVWEESEGGERREVKHREAPGSRVSPSWNSSRRGW